MKPLITSGVSLLVGLAIGGYIGYRYYDRHVTNEAVQQMLQASESSDREHVARAVRSIEMIESGESSNAVRLLSRPIADFYRFHANLTHNDERTRDVLAMIERLAGTNSFVADEIHAKIQ